MNPKASSETNVTSNALRRYLPLIGFVVPTLVVGYGIVIPQSCIAGVNELSIGFGTTILGAAMTYVAGQHAAIAKGVCSKPPLRVRLTRAINRQAASPSGLFGRLLALIWPKEHGRLNVEVLDQLDLRPGQRVLEIGSGTGHALREAALRSAGGYVLGLDISELMLRRARALNRNSIARGEVDLRLGDIATLPLGEETFDRIFSVHCIYFWHDVDAVLAKLSHALSPDGKLVLAFRPESDDIPARFRDATYRFPRVEQVQAVLERLGLEIERTTMSGVSPAVVLLTAMRRQSADVCQTSSGLAWEPARPSPAEHD